MKARASSLFHLLRITPVSAVADWRLLLPTITAVILLDVGIVQWFWSHGNVDAHRNLRGATVIFSCIALWVSSAAVTRLGLVHYRPVLDALPIPKPAKALVYLVEHFLMLLLWAVSPVLVLFLLTDQEPRWYACALVYFLTGNSIFALLRILFDLFRQLTWVEAKLLGEGLLSIGLGSIFAAPWIAEGLFKGDELEIPQILIVGLSVSTAGLLSLTLFSSSIRLPRGGPGTETWSFDVQKQSIEINDFASPLWLGSPPTQAFLRIAAGTFVRVFATMACWLYMFNVHDRLLFWLLDLLQPSSHLLFFVCVSLPPMALCFYLSFQVFRSLYLFLCLSSDCQQRPVRANLVTLLALIQILATTLSLPLFAWTEKEGMSFRTTFPACFAFGTALTVWSFAELPRLRLKGEPFARCRLAEWSVLAGSLVSMVLTLTGGILLPESMSALLTVYGVLILYNVYAMHWMWRRF